MVLVAVGVGLQIVGQIKEGQMKSAAEKYNAAVAYSQAEVYRQTGKFESEALAERGRYEQQRIAREKGKTLSAQRAAYGASGVRIFEGSPLEVQADTAAQYELDIAADKYNVALGLERIRYETDVGVSRSVSEAKYRRRLAKSYRTQSYLRAGSTLLTGAGMMGGGGGGGYGTPPVTTSTPGGIPVYGG